MKARITHDYGALRRAAYPPAEDYFDAVFHERMGNPEPMKAYLAACQAVKERFPKPSATPVAPEPRKPVTRRRKASK